MILTKKPRSDNLELHSRLISLSRATPASQMEEAGLPMKGRARVSSQDCPPLDSSGSYLTMNCSPTVFLNHAVKTALILRTIHSNRNRVSGSHHQPWLTYHRTSQGVQSGSTQIELLIHTLFLPLCLQLQIKSSEKGQSVSLWQHMSLCRTVRHFSAVNSGKLSLGTVSCPLQQTSFLCSENNQNPLL